MESVSTKKYVRKKSVYVVKILISHICIKTIIIKINEYCVNGRLIYRIKKSRIKNTAE